MSSEKKPLSADVEFFYYFHTSNMPIRSTDEILNRIAECSPIGQSLLYENRFTNLKNYWFETIEKNTGNIFTMNENSCRAYSFLDQDFLTLPNAYNFTIYTHNPEQPGKHFSVKGSDHYKQKLLSRENFLFQTNKVAISWDEGSFSHINDFKPDMVWFSYLLGNKEVYLDEEGMKYLKLCENDKIRKYV